MFTYILITYKDICILAINIEIYFIDKLFDIPKHSLFWIWVVFAVPVLGGVGSLPGKESLKTFVENKSTSYTEEPRNNLTQPSDPSPLPSLSPGFKRNSNIWWWHWTIQNQSISEEKTQKMISMTTSAQETTQPCISLTFLFVSSIPWLGKCISLSRTWSNG